MSAIPSGRLFDLCEINIGRTPRRDQPRYWGGSNPWASIRDLSQGEVFETRECISDEAVSSVMPRPAKTGTLMASFKLTIGRVAVAARDLHHNEAIVSLPLKRPDLIDPQYLRHILPKVMLAEQSNNAVLGQVLNKGKLEQLSIPLPPLDEQRRIVGLLDRAAEIARRADAARAKARAIVPALFLETFGDPATNPKGWRMMTVGDLLESASYGTSKKANDRDEGIPMLRMGNVTIGGQLDTGDLKHIRIEGQEREKTEVLEGDLLFNRTNSKELVGKTGLWDGRFEAVAASYFIRLRVKRALCDSTYLWAFFNSQFMKRTLFDTARGAIGQANINAKELRAFRVSTPPLPLQTAFAEQVQRLESLARRLDAAAATAEALAAALSAEVLG